MSQSCCYAIVNTVTREMYIGATGHWSARRKKHFQDLRQGKHGNPRLQAAWDTLGPETLKIVKLVECNPEDLPATEQKLISHYRPAYNMTAFANPLDRFAVHNGMNISQAARAVGMEPGTLDQRLRRGIPLEKALTDPVKPSYHSGAQATWEYEGKKYTISGLAKHVGMRPHKLWQRLTAGYPIERAVDPAPLGPWSRRRERAAGG